MSSKGAGRAAANRAESCLHVRCRHTHRLLLAVSSRSLPRPPKKRAVALQLLHKGSARHGLCTHRGCLLQQPAKRDGRLCAGLRQAHTQLVILAALPSFDKAAAAAAAVWLTEAVVRREACVPCLLTLLVPGSLPSLDCACAASIAQHRSAAAEQPSPLHTSHLGQQHASSFQKRAAQQGARAGLCSALQLHIVCSWQSRSLSILSGSLPCCAGRLLQKVRQRSAAARPLAEPRLC